MPPPASPTRGPLTPGQGDSRDRTRTRNALSTAGYAPLVTAETEDLGQVLRTEKPRLVLLDVMLPGADGIELMELVPELSDVPVIFISGYGRDETVARALDVGAADCIVKPFFPTELVARVRPALRRVWIGREDVNANLVRIFVRNLRRKLGDDASNPEYVFNVRGVGYRMLEPGPDISPIIGTGPQYVG